MLLIAPSIYVLTLSYIDERVAILMVGQTGVGKSLIAQALGHCAARQERDVLFVTQPDLIRKLHAANATGALRAQVLAVRARAAADR